MILHHTGEVLGKKKKKNNKMLRSVSASPLAPSVKVKLISAGFHTAADVSEVQLFQLCKGTPLCTH